MAINTPKHKITLTAWWGNDDASSTISFSSEQWLEIQKGGEHIDTVQSWYEGECDEVFWRFKDAEFSIDGDDGRQCVVDSPISELIIEED